MTATPAGASTQAITTDTTATGLAAKIATKSYPSGSPIAVVATADTQAQAASYALEIDAPLLVSNSTTDAAALISQLRALGATHVSFVSSTPFTQEFADQLTDQGIAVDENISGATQVALDTALVAATAPERLVVVDKRNSADLAIGTNLALGSEYALTLIDGSETEDEMKTFFTRFSPIPVTLYGDASTVLDQVSEEQAQNFEQIASDTPLETQMAGVDQVVGSGRKANRMYVAPSDSITSITSNAMLAAAQNGVPLLGGTSASIAAQGTPAATNLKLWASELDSLDIVGLNMTTADSALLLKYASGTRTAASAWHVTDTTVTSTRFTVSFSAYSGASRYVAYDLLGNVAGYSSTPSITVKGNPVELAIVAQDSSSKELRRFEFSLNRYLDADDQQTAAIASRLDGSTQTTLVVLGSLKAPRTITRTMIDPFDATVKPVLQTIATTCRRTFTDTSLDPTKQYTYDFVTEGGLDNQACNSSAPAEPDLSTALDLQVSGVTVPATTYPATSSAVASKSLRAAAETSHAAMPTLTDSQLMPAQSTSSAKSTLMAQKRAGGVDALAAQATAAGPNYRIRWVAFIQSSKVFFPGLTNNTAYPFIAFGGDGRGPGNPTGTARARADINFYFQNSPQSISMTPHTDDSHRYMCSPFSCQLTGTQNAGNSGITLTSQSISGSVGIAQLRIHSALPFIPLAPAIDVDMKFRLQPGNSTMVGYHDAMPTHEVYGGVIPGEYHRIYLQSEKGLQCLFPSTGRCQLQINRAL
ncbi:hypothetical protein [Curtobacterium flaccumfaciens]|uniref:hypothetical protein n=1 Tax=Curtobacterium flaccumfaciens TaxID=2035 RepID=UPI00217F0CE0|nr:hypothetical protein [Curtobacterium flaccumfaciens]MCS6588086.1 hypothetical protein [Curtobacterium flaccumfaciens pv. flaccumfaciens]